MKSYHCGDWLVTEFRSVEKLNKQLVKNSISGHQFERIIDERSVAVEVWIRLIEQAEVSLIRPDKAYVRWGVRVLAMVAELHKLGFQRLRIVPYMSPSGVYWRCSITTVDNILSSHGAMFALYNPDMVTYSSGSENAYFDWTDAKNDSARQLAARFMIRFPSLTERGRGQDWPYVGWFQYMLGLAERGDVPISFTNESTHTDFEWLPTVGLSNGSLQLDRPPGGEAAG